jgi:hypothetical protein
VNRRLGLPAVLAILGVTIVALVAVASLIRGEDEPEPTAATCRPVAVQFGSPPEGFAYEKVDEKTRRTTIRALRLDGRVEMRAARRDGLTLGTLVGAPSRDPQGYVDELVRTAEKGTAVSRRPGYTVIPLESGTLVAVGVRGCTAMLISAQDPRAVQFLAEAVFAGRSPR